MMRLARVLMAAPVAYAVLVVITVITTQRFFISFSDVYISLIAYALGRMIARRERR